jgi:hypothetical protein
VVKEESKRRIDEDRLSRMDWRTIALIATKLAVGAPTDAMPPIVTSIADAARESEMKCGRGREWKSV